RIEIRDGRVSEAGAPETEPQEAGSALVRAPSPGGPVIPGGRPPRRKRGFPWGLLLIAGLIVAGGIGAVALATGQPPFGTTPTPDQPVVTDTARVARGEVHPEQEANIRSVSPGVVA